MTIALIIDSTLIPAAGPGDPQLLHIVAVGTNRSGLIVAVAATRDVIDETVTVVEQQLVILGIGGLLLAGIGAWLLAGAALRPVERMCRQAADLQAHDAFTELAVPSTNDEISRLALTTNALLKQLFDALQRERRFVADAGHELRTPLSILKLELELARRGDRTREYLAQTITSASYEADRLIKLTEDLLAVARPADRSLFGERFDVTSVVSEALAPPAPGQPIEAWQSSARNPTALAWPPGRRP